MNWAIKDEYFEKVYGKSYKPKVGGRQWRVRHRKTPGYSTWTFTEDNDSNNGTTIRNGSESVSELQSELSIVSQGTTPHI